jgi:hypothetical protein
LSGISENEGISIGSNVNSLISKQIKRINKIKDNKLIPNKIKKKNSHKVDENKDLNINVY